MDLGQKRTVPAGLVISGPHLSGWVSWESYCGRQIIKIISQSVPAGKTDDEGIKNSELPKSRSLKKSLLQESTTVTEK